MGYGMHQHSERQHQSLKMDGFASQLARLRAHVIAQRALPFDLGAWAIDELSRVAGSNELRLRRNGHLHRAGEIIGGTVRHRALGILKESAALDRTNRARNIDFIADDPLRVEVKAARLIAPIPAERQLRTILACSGADYCELAMQRVPFSNPHAENLTHEPAFHRVT